eukprot:TRINITY_DN34735_c0_g1_i1.p1 TRINITY_DN34735_c0_g1~~TRINITY_DN34735_c0_g1_i1.p1  ORF type:complete len:654 (-),score=116.65 TRINITY_DN34735_c0_g1_i1:69-2030(-)
MVLVGSDASSRAKRGTLVISSTWTGRRMMRTSVTAVSVSAEWSREFLVVFAYHPCYFNMRFQELEALASLVGVTSREELYVEDPPPTALCDSPVVRIRLPGGEASARTICERAVLIKAVLDVWSYGDTWADAVNVGMAAGPSQIAARHASVAAPKTMQIKVMAFGRTASMEDKKAIIEGLRPLFSGEEEVDLKSSDVVVWALEEHYHHTTLKTNGADTSGQPRRVYVGRQVAGGRSTDKKQKDGDKAFFQKYDLSNRAVLGPTTMENQMAFLMANCAAVRRGQAAMDPFCGTGGLLLAMSHFGAHITGGEIDIRVVKGYRVAYVKNREAARQAAQKRGILVDGATPSRPSRPARPESGGGYAVAAAAQAPAPAAGETRQADAMVVDSQGAAEDANASTPATASKPGGKMSNSERRKQRKEEKARQLEENPEMAQDANIRDIFTNFYQYDLAKPEIVVCDSSSRPWRRTSQGWLDCIVTDPPYGVRAGTRKPGKTFPQAADGATFTAAKIGYGDEELSCDLLNLAAAALRDGGRIVYLVPVDLADFLGIDRAAERGDSGDAAMASSWAAVRTTPGGEAPAVKTLHDITMPKGGRPNKDPRLCISETTRDPMLLDESRYLDFLPQHSSLELLGASLQVLSGGLGRLLVTMRRVPR